MDAIAVRMDYIGVLWPWPTLAAVSALIKMQSMVRRDVMRVPASCEEGTLVTRCASPTGESPVPVSVGAPGSRPQVGRETFLPERGVESLRGNASCAAGSKHTGRNLK